MESSPVKLLQQIKKRVQSVTYGSPLYRMMLDQGAVPERIRLSLPDLWPGDAKRGQALIASQPTLFDNLEEKQSSDTSERREAYSFSFLRDLRAVGTDLARRKCVSLIHEWMSDGREWSEDSWSPDIVGARLSHWIAFYDFYGPAASHDFTKSLLACMARQLRHLIHTAPAHLIGPQGLQVIKGLLYGGLALIESEKSCGIALDALRRQLETEILPDGGTVFRNPQTHAEMLQTLIDLRHALRAAQMEIPPELTLTLSRMVPALKLMRHGDGGLALFNGAREGQALRLDAIVTLSEAKGRALKRLPQTGYERLTAGRSLLLIDAGTPPPAPYDSEAHAGLMSFEFSVGKERLFTNCGAPAQADEPDWRVALAATAAHNTITLDDLNACEVLPEGGIGHRPAALTLHRYEQDGAQIVEMSHDGYKSRKKALVHRCLSLSDDGHILWGREALTLGSRRAFSVRWHIHPEVDVLLAQGGDSALLRTPSGAGWRFRVHGAGGESLALESSVYCGIGGARRSLQLRISGVADQDKTTIEWSLTRDKIKKGG